MSERRKWIMNYYVEEVHYFEGIKKTAGIKARDDVATILKEVGFREILIDFPGDRPDMSLFNKATAHVSCKKKWDQKLAHVGYGDSLLIQFPIINNTVFFQDCVKKVQNRGAKVILLIHDVDILRTSLEKDVPFRTKLRMKIEEMDTMKQCDAMIVHNKRMRNSLIRLGIDPGKITTLGLFDYMVDEQYEKEAKPQVEKDLPVVIAGNLSRFKSGYIYDLPDNVEFNLYGIGVEDSLKDHTHYKGSFLPDELPGKLQGSYGLIWDGDRTDTCSGPYGEYLKINNPHKMSLYLTAGLPVIVWEESAMAVWVMKYSLGITIASLKDLESRLIMVSDEEYNQFKSQAKKMSEKLKHGYFLKKTIQRVLNN